MPAQSVPHSPLNLLPIYSDRYATRKSSTNGALRCRQHTLLLIK
ncbi:MAG: hypothetical protein ACKOQS_00025 [Dolichospermum sp.]